MIAAKSIARPTRPSSPRRLKRGGYGGEISAIIGEEMFDDLTPVGPQARWNNLVPLPPIWRTFICPTPLISFLPAKKMF